MPWTVAELTKRVKSTLESSFPSVEVQGEVTDLSRPSSGHLYFTLKDAKAQVRGIIWRSTAARMKFQLENGQQLVCLGDVEVYAARGSYQLVVRRALPAGVGDLQLAFEQLRQRLENEGMFALERKKPLPPFPRRIAFVTSPGGAAIRDFLEVAGRRSKAVQVLLIPAQVQGAGAAESICRGLAAAERIRPSLDVVVVGRGGGSLEDLWCFNEEKVVRRIAAMRLPVVSAVGHEVDVTLSDLVADRRALTPSEAAELLVPSQDQMRQMLTMLHARMKRSVDNRLNEAQNQLRLLQSRPVLSRPLDAIKQLARRLDELDMRALRAIGAQHSNAGRRLGALAASLEALSPLHVLARGYSVTLDQKTGRTLRTVTAVQPGDRVTTRVADGQFESIVQSRMQRKPGQP